MPEEIPVPSTQDSFPKTCTKQEIAKFLRLTPRSIENAMKSGWLPYWRIGRRSVRFDLDAVKAALNEKCRHN